MAYNASLGVYALAGGKLMQSHAEELEQLRMGEQESEEWLMEYKKSFSLSKYLMPTLW